MKKLLLLPLLLSLFVADAQITGIPDANFEQALIDFGWDTPPINGSVPTANIDTIQLASFINYSISDLTGIEDFILLTNLSFQYNQLTSVNLTQNILLDYLECSNNQLTSLDLSQNSVLYNLYCGWNQLSTLDLTSNIALAHVFAMHNQLTSIIVPQTSTLEILQFDNNQISSIDVSPASGLTNLVCDTNLLTSLDLTQNPNLSFLFCRGNQLNCLNLKNGFNNPNLFNIYTTSNPNLTCIEVDNIAWANAFWTDIDPQHFYSTSCPNPCAVGIDELKPYSANIYPNPTSGSLSITLEKASTGVLNIRNYLGQLIKQEEFSNTTELNISLNGPSGLYFLQLAIDGEIINKKLVKE